MHSKPRVLTADMLAFRADGWSMPRIARHFGVSTVAVSRYISRRNKTLAGHRVASGACDLCGVPGVPLSVDQRVWVVAVSG